jgi:hypothetical protein
MFTRIDHVMICVAELERGMDAYARLGFSVHPGGVHTGKGTHNAIAFNESDYLELLAVRDRDEYLRHSPYPGLPEFVAQGGGLRYVILQSDDLAAEVAAMRARGVDVSDAIDGARRTPSGQELRWRAALLGARTALPLFFIQHLTPLAQRRTQVPATAHPNGVLGIERAYVVVNDAAMAAADYARVLGLPVPRLERGTVINADMAVFNVGPTGLVVAQPAGPGPAADALARRGPGPFQILYRTRSMGAAARWMEAHGVPPPARGTRSTGEQAMLVTADRACGVNIGFVGAA